MSNLFFQGNIGIYNTTRLEQYEIDQVIEGIRTGNFKGYDLAKRIEEIRKHDPNDERGVKELKEGLAFLLSSSLVAQANVANNVVYHTGAAQLDFDQKEITDVESRMKKSEADKKIISNDPNVLMAFISPSGGLKVLCRIQPDILNHDLILEALAKYFLDTYGMVHDPSCKGIKRAMYLSYDPNIYVNLNCATFIDYEIPITKWEETNSSKPTMVDPIEMKKVDEIIAQIIERKLDFAPTHSDWVKIAFALCSFGEDGRTRFHEVCQFSPAYDSRACDKQYDQCLKRFDGRSGLGTFFHYAKIYGLTIPKDKPKDTGRNSSLNTPLADRNDESELEKLDQILSETSTLPDSVFENVPDPIRSAAAVFTDYRIRDLFLLSLITVLSSLFPKVFGFYDNAKVFPNLFSFIIGPPASGKGVVRWALKCLKRVSSFIISLNSEATTSSAPPDSKDYEKPIPSTNLIPGNISISGLIQLLSNNQIALMFESEADAVSKLFDVSFGDYSDKLRQIAHHEPLYSYRKIGKEYITIDEPKMSLLVTGTPSQIEKLVRGREDGLFSRMMYYSFSGRPKFRSPFSSTVSYASLFEIMADDVYEIFKNFYEKDCQIKLTELQIKKFNEVMERWQSIAFEHHRSIGVSVVNRMGLILFRIAMVLTILRNRVPASEIYCSDQDFNTALSICEVLRVHSFTVLRVIPKKPDLKPDENKVKSEFYKILPYEFKYSEGIALCEVVGIGSRQAKRYIRELVNEGKLLDGIPKKGYYKKA